MNTKEGRAIIRDLKKEGHLDDLCGHGAILRYYPELIGKGVNKEVTDFSSPNNFPDYPQYEEDEHKHPDEDANAGKNIAGE